MSLNIGVFLGSQAGNDKKVSEQINKFADWMVKNNHTLIIGGTDQGLMKNLAQVVYGKNCKVKAIYTKNIYSLCKEPNFFSELIITKDTYSKKKIFENLSDVFVAFPGGLGTLDEIVDVTNVEVTNKSAGLYSDETIDIREYISADGRILYAPENVIYELKFPDADIKGTIR